MAILNADVNQFPTLTWNHLNINRSHAEGELLKRAELEFNSVNSISFKEISSQNKPEALSVKTGLGKEAEAFLDGNSGLMYCFTVKAGASSSEPVKINFDTQKNEKAFADIVLEAEEGSNSTFIFVIKGNGKEFTASRIRVLMQENAHLHLITVNLSGDSKYLEGIGSVVPDNSVFELTELELGSSITNLGILNELAGYKASYNGRTAYLVNENRKLDINQVCVQKGKESLSQFTVDGILMDSASKTWRGTIDFKNGCAEAKGDEQENVLLLNPEVVNKSLPVILCDEEAVEGRHGCTIGKMDSENMFYMQSRGIDENTAKILLVKAKISAVCRYIPDPDLNNEILSYVEGVFNK